MPARGHRAVVSLPPDVDRSRDPDGVLLLSAVGVSVGEGARGSVPSYRGGAARGSVPPPNPPPPPPPRRGRFSLEDPMTAVSIETIQPDPAVIFDDATAALDEDFDDDTDFAGDDADIDDVPAQRRSED